MTEIKINRKILEEIGYLKKEETIRNNQELKTVSGSIHEQRCRARLGISKKIFSRLPHPNWYIVNSANTHLSK